MSKKDTKSITLTLPISLITEMENVANDRMISKNKVAHTCLTTMTSMYDLINGTQTDVPSGLLKEDECPKEIFE